MHVTTNRWFSGQILANASLELLVSTIKSRHLKWIDQQMFEDLGANLLQQKHQPTGVTPVGMKVNLE